MADEFRLTSRAFHEGGRIPRKHTADGPVHSHDLSPPLEWYSVPEGTESLALVCEDLDASDSDAPLVPFVHWVVINIPSTLKGLPEGYNSKQMGEIEEYGDLQEGVNDFKSPGYRGPNQPAGTQTIEFRLYALDCKLHMGKKPTKDKLDEAIVGHVLGVARLSCNYSNQKHEKSGYMSARDPFDGQSLQ